MITYVLSPTYLILHQKVHHTSYFIGWSYLINTSKLIRRINNKSFTWAHSPWGQVALEITSPSVLRLHSVCIISVIISRWLSPEQISQHWSVRDSHACIMIIQLLPDWSPWINNTDRRLRTIDVKFEKWWRNLKPFSCFVCVLSLIC